MSDVYSFISLSDARCKLAHDLFRFKRFAVLTFDDGYRSSLPFLKWLDASQIPYTLFINGKYLDGQSCSEHILENARLIKGDVTEREIADGLYLKQEDLVHLNADVGSHGYEHVNAVRLSRLGFEELINKNFDTLKNNKIAVIPFHAYTWGRHNSTTDAVLSEMSVVPVLMDGQMNYNNPKIIHRELFPSSFSV